ncbi:hypothetical protein Afe04nite_27400 [Asanoa ferruginea]|nr:hypothetical protein Afe04nite_27400 [Asanoa ferruginea]
MDEASPVHHDGQVTTKQRWVIIAVCAATAAVLAAVALVVGLQGIEVLSWLAGIAALIAALLGPILAHRSPTTEGPPSTQRESPHPTDPPAWISAPKDTASAPDRGPSDVRHARGVQINLGNGGNTQHNTFNRPQDRP